MSDLVLLFKNYKEYFSKYSVKSTKLLFLIYSFLYSLKLYSSAFNNNNIIINKLFEAFNISKGLIVVILCFCMIVYLIIAVNLTYFFISLANTLFDKNDFNKNSVKSLIYTSYLVPFILNTLINIIFQIITKTDMTLKMININSITTYFLVSILIYLTLKLNIKLNKSAKYITLIILLINIYNSASYLIKQFI